MQWWKSQQNRYLVRTRSKQMHFFFIVDALVFRFSWNNNMEFDDHSPFFAHLFVSQPNKVILVSFPLVRSYIIGWIRHGEKFDCLRMQLQCIINSCTRDKVMNAWNQYRFAYVHITYYTCTRCPSPLRECVKKCELANIYFAALIAFHLIFPFLPSLIYKRPNGIGMIWIGRVLFDVGLQCNSKKDLGNFK